MPKPVMKSMKVMLLQVKSKDAFGRPRECLMIHEDDLVDVSKPENREFITGLIEPHLVAPRTKVKG